MKKWVGHFKVSFPFRWGLRDKTIRKWQVNIRLLQAIIFLFVKDWKLISMLIESWQLVSFSWFLWRSNNNLVLVWWPGNLLWVSQFWFLVSCIGAQYRSLVKIIISYNVYLTLLTVSLPLKSLFLVSSNLSQYFPTLY
jgi:hypothetical protein